MEEAVHRCHERGIGLFAIKSMALCVQDEAELRKLPLDDDELASLLAAQGVTFEQAKLQAIWHNPHVASVCSLMPTLAILRSNAAAAMDERPPSAEVATLLADHAKRTGSYFCRRCGACDTATADQIPISEIMEMLMYWRAYGMRELAVQGFARIPGELRSKIPGSDYSKAEESCPQKMAIAELVKEAYAALGP
jgi:predicted aldo/keto reductase-like oxidoreductase